MAAWFAPTKESARVRVKMSFKEDNRCFYRWEGRSGARATSSCGRKRREPKPEVVCGPVKKEKNFIDLLRASTTFTYFAERNHVDRVVLSIDRSKQPL